MQEIDQVFANKFSDRNIAFLVILSGLAIAFALSFGMGGREFAKKQLEKLDDKINQ